MLQADSMNGKQEGAMRRWVDPQPVMWIAPTPLILQIFLRYLSLQKTWLVLKHDAASKANLSAAFEFIAATVTVLPTRALM